LTDDKDFTKSLEDDFHLSSDASQDGNDSKDDAGNNDDWSDASDTMTDDEVDDEMFDNWLTREDDSTSDTEKFEIRHHSKIESRRRHI
jgi:hypothetical protein